MESELPDLKFRADFSVYFRTSDRQLQNELGEQSRWRAGYTYDHARKSPGKDKHNDKGTGNDSGGTFRRDYRDNYRVVSCAEWEGEPDNGNDYNWDWGNSNYQGSTL